MTARLRFTPVCAARQQPHEGAVGRERLERLILAHIVYVHVVDIAGKTAFCDFGCFGGRVSLYFVSLYLVVEVFYIDLEQVGFGAVGAAALAIDVVVVGGGREEGGLK